MGASMTVPSRWRPSVARSRGVSVRTWRRRGGGARCGARGLVVARTPTSWVAGDSGTASASLSRPPRMSRSSPSAAGDDRHAASGTCGTAPRPRRRRTPRTSTVGLGLAAAHAGVELRAEPLGRQQLPVERRHHAAATSARRSCAARRPPSGRAAGSARAPAPAGRRPRAPPCPATPGRASASIGDSDSTDSAWLTMSSSRPRYSSRRTWLIGSSRAPNFDFVLRTPLATARTLPFSSVSSTTMRSASPSLYVRSTTAVSR